MRFIKDTLTTFSTQIIAVVLGLAATIAIARILGPEGKGAYTLILLVPSVLITLGGLGIEISNIYFGGSKKYEWNKLASNSLISALLLGFPLAIAFLAYYFIARPTFLGNIESVCLVLAILMVPLGLLSSYFQSILRGQNRIAEYNLTVLLCSLILVGLVLLALFAFESGVFGVILAWAIALIASTILSVFLVYKTTPIDLKLYPSVLKESIKFGVKGYIGNIIQFINYRLDMFLVAVLLTPALAIASVGYYSISVSLAEALWYFPSAVGLVVLSRTPGLSPREANKSTPLICRNTLFITFIAALLLFVFGKYIILLLFGSSFLPAVQPLQILLPGIVALSIGKVLSNEIAGRGKPIIGTIAAGISLAVNLPLNLFLIPKIGISGAALASTVAYCLATLIVITAFTKISKKSWKEILFIKKSDFKFYKNFIILLKNKCFNFLK